MNIIIRNEQKSDIDSISEVTIAAFKNHPYSQKTEQFIINALRKAGVLIISLVAEIDGKIIGHIAFSPVTIADQECDWYGAGPFSVLPEYQRKGVGKALMNEGLILLKESGAMGCVLTGDPNYYRQFGFHNTPQLIYEGVPPENFLVLPFNKHIPEGIVVFDEAFLATR